MSTDWLPALKAVIDRIGSIVSEAATLRVELRNLARAILEATSDALPAQGIPPARDIGQPAAESPAAAPETAPGPTQEQEYLLPAQAQAPEGTASEVTLPAETQETGALEPADAGETLAAPAAAPALAEGNAPALEAPAAQELPVPATAARSTPSFAARIRAAYEASTSVPEPASGGTSSSAASFPRFVPGQWRAPTDEDLPQLEARCRLKAEATRWFLTRQRLEREGTPRSEIDERAAAIIRRAKELPDCYLWIIHGTGFSPTNLASFGNLAGCYDTVAAAMALARDVLAEANTPLTERCLILVAEAQSALRTAIDAIDGPTDPDQKGVYDWLRHKAAYVKIYIPRFMRGEDRADPTRWENLLGRLTTLEEDLKQYRTRERQRRKLLQKVQFELKVIAGRPDDPIDHWRTVAAAIDALVRDGLPPSHRETRDLLLPFLDDIPHLEDAPVGFQRTLREIDRYLANRPEIVEPRAEREPSAEAREVAQLLEGQCLVLIGGTHRPQAREALLAAFRLKDLLWVEIDEYQSLQTFEPYIARPDVAVVLLAIRWSRHSFGEVQQFCERYDKPLVRLPAGYNPNQVAAQILAQCSERLAAKRVAAAGRAANGERGAAAG